jgi:hypothetical protein
VIERGHGHCINRIGTDVQEPKKSCPAQLEVMGTRNLPTPPHGWVSTHHNLGKPGKEMTMARATLFQAACAAAMLAATPVFAQSNNPAGDSGAANAPVSHDATPGSHHMTGHMHHSATGDHHAKSHMSESSGDAAVDRLNDQSYQAAQKGEAFDAGTPAAPPPGGKM